MTRFRAWLARLSMPDRIAVGLAVLLVVLIALSRGDEPAAAVEARSFDLGAVALLAAGLALLLLSKRFPGTVVLAVIALTVTWYQAERSRWRPAGTDREQAEQLAAFLEFARGHSLFAVFWLAANTGIRRSERLGHSTPGFTGHLSARHPGDAGRGCADLRSHPWRMRRSTGFYPVEVPVERLHAERPSRPGGPLRCTYVVAGGGLNLRPSGYEPDRAVGKCRLVSSCASEQGLLPLAVLV